MPLPSGHDCKIFSNSLKQKFKSFNFDKMYLQGITIPPPLHLVLARVESLVASPVISPPSSNTSRNNFDKHFGTWPIGRPAISLNLSFLFSSVTISWTWSETLLCKKEYDSSCSFVALWIKFCLRLHHIKHCELFISFEESCASHISGQERCKVLVSLDPFLNTEIKSHFNIIKYL